MQRSDDLPSITEYVYGVWSVSGGQPPTSRWTATRSEPSSVRKFGSRSCAFSFKDVSYRDEDKPKKSPIASLKKQALMLMK